MPLGIDDFLEKMAAEQPFHGIQFVIPASMQSGFLLADRLIAFLTHSDCSVTQGL
jgi:hypothetical protein